MLFNLCVMITDWQIKIRCWCGEPNEMSVQFSGVLTTTGWVAEWFRPPHCTGAPNYGQEPLSEVDDLRNNLLYQVSFRLSSRPKPNIDITNVVVVKSFDFRPVVDSVWSGRSRPPGQLMYQFWVNIPSILWWMSKHQLSLQAGWQFDCWDRRPPGRRQSARLSIRLERNPPGPAHLSFLC